MTKERHTQPESQIPARINLMKPNSKEKLPQDFPDWISELDWSGVRVAVVIVNPGDIRILADGKENITAKFPDLKKGFSKIGLRHQNVIIEGKIIHGAGTSQGDIRAIRKRINADTAVANKMASETPSKFIAFDILRSDGTDFTTRPFEERLEHLKKLFTPAVSRDHDMSSNYNTQYHQELVIAGKRKGLSRILLKRKRGLYNPASRKDWVVVNLSNLD